MIKKMLFGFAVIFSITGCKENVTTGVKNEIGKVWLSGGLYYCAQQIHLNNGDTLVVVIENIATYKSGVEVKVTYRETGRSEFCPYAISGEIISIETTQ